MIQNLLISTFQRLSEGIRSGDVYRVSIGPIVGMLTHSCRHHWSQIQNSSQYFNGYVSMEMCGVWSLLFIAIMAAAKVGCNGSCTRSKSQAGKGEWPEQNPEHIPAAQHVTHCHLSLVVAEAWRHTQLWAGSLETCHLESSCQKLPSFSC